MNGADYRWSEGRERSRGGLVLLAVALFGLGTLLIGYWYEHRGHDTPTGLRKLVVQLHDLPSGYRVFYSGRDAKVAVSRSSDGYGVAYQHEKGAVVDLLRAPVLVISSHHHLSNCCCGPRGNEGDRSPECRAADHFLPLLTSAACR